MKLNKFPSDSAFVHPVKAVQTFGALRLMAALSRLLAVAGAPLTLWAGKAPPPRASKMKLTIRTQIMKTFTSSIRAGAIGLLTLAATVIGAWTARAADAPPDDWQWRNPLPTGSAIFGITYANSKFVAVGEGQILLSGDGANWKPVPSPTGKILWSVAYGSNAFVAVGEDGLILRSTDAMTWQAVSSPANSTLTKVIYGGGKFVAVAIDQILSSADGLIWSVASAADLGVFRIYSVAAYGNGVFMVAADLNINPTTALLRSTDGVQWNRTTVSGAVQALAFGNGVFTAGNIYSSDGLNWASTDLPGSQSPTDLTFGNGLFVGCARTPGQMLRSADGIHWTVETGFSFGDWGAVTFQCVAFGDGLFVAAQTSYGGVIIRSTDGVNWISNNPDAKSLADFLYSGTYANGRFVTVGFQGAIWYSDGGKTWLKAASGTDLDLNCVAYGDGQFVTLGETDPAGTGTLMSLRSADGAQWGVNSTGLDHQKPTALSFLNGSFVAFTAGFPNGLPGYVLRSTDGLNWNILTSTDPSTAGVQIKSIVYANGLYVAAGNRIYTSPDLVNWTARTDLFFNPESNYGAWLSITYANGRFVVVGSHGEVSSSPDGLNWTPIVYIDDYFAYPMGGDLMAAQVTFFNGEFLVAEAGDPYIGRIWRSVDGINWDSSSGARVEWYGICSGGGSAIAFGALGAIVQLTPGIPHIGGISPDTADQNGPEFTLTVCGSGFAAGATVLWNGAARPTTFVSESQLTATIPATDLAINTELSSVQVAVQNSSGALSTPAAFVIRDANVLASQSTAAAPGETVNVSSAPTGDSTSGISATLTNSSGTGAATVAVASYQSDPSPGLAFGVAGNFLDLQVTGADPGDSMTAQFYYPPDANEAVIALKYYNAQTARWEDVLSSQGVPPVLDTRDNLDATVSGGRFTVIFDSTSTPSITALGGTYFAQAIQPPISFTGFLAPIGGADSTGGSFSAPLRTLKMGSTIPLKFTGTAGGAPLLSGFHRLSTVKYTSSTTAGTPIDATPQDAATSGNLFRQANGEWHFNLDTKATGMSVGIWQLIATLADGSRHTVWIQLK
jgi:hypothetical protein